MKEGCLCRHYGESEKEAQGCRRERLRKWLWNKVGGFLWECGFLCS